MLYPRVQFNLYSNDNINYKIVSDGIVRYRSPKINLSQDYWLCIGTSMTFGRFVDCPFPKILNDHYPTMNFGYGHLDTQLIFNHAPHRKIIEKASLVIIQYSPLEKYLRGLPFIINICKKTLMIVFRDIQKGNHCFKAPIIIPGEGILNFYPSQETHHTAAKMILRKINNF